MCKKSNTLKSSLPIILGLMTAFGAFAQASGSIEEIAELNRQKVVTELKKQIDSSKAADRALDAVKEANLRMNQPPKENLADQAPEVISIFGVRADALQAVISTATSRNMRVRVGEFSANGWEVEKITPNFVTFRREVKNRKPSKSVSKAGIASQNEGAVSYQRVTAGLSNAQRTASNPLGVSGSMPLPMYPQPGQPMQGMGYAFQSQTPALIQMPPLAPMPVTPATQPSGAR